MESSSSPKTAGDREVEVEDVHSITNLMQSVAELDLRSPTSWTGLKNRALYRVEEMSARTALYCLRVLSNHGVCGPVEGRRLQERVVPYINELKAYQAVDFLQCVHSTSHYLVDSAQKKVLEGFSRWVQSAKASELVRLASCLRALFSSSTSLSLLDEIAARAIKITKAALLSGHDGVDDFSRRERIRLLWELAQCSGTPSRGAVELLRLWLCPDLLHAAQWTLADPTALTVLHYSCGAVPLHPSELVPRDVVMLAFTVAKFLNRCNGLSSATLRKQISAAGVGSPWVPADPRILAMLQLPPESASKRVPTLHPLALQSHIDWLSGTFEHALAEGCFHHYCLARCVLRILTQSCFCYVSAAALRVAQRLITSILTEFSVAAEQDTTPKPPTDTSPDPALCRRETGHHLITEADAVAVMEAVRALKPFLSADFLCDCTRRIGVQLQRLFLTTTCELLPAMLSNAVLIDLLSQPLIDTVIDKMQNRSLPAEVVQVCLCTVAVSPQCSTKQRERIRGALVVEKLSSGQIVRQIGLLTRYHSKSREHTEQEAAHLCALLVALARKSGDQGPTHTQCLTAVHALASLAPATLEAKAVLAVQQLACRLAVPANLPNTAVILRDLLKLGLPRRCAAVENVIRYFTTNLLMRARQSTASNPHQLEWRDAALILVAAHGMDLPRPRDPAVWHALRASTTDLSSLNQRSALEVVSACAYYGDDHPNTIRNVLSAHFITPELLPEDQQYLLATLLSDLTEVDAQLVVKHLRPIAVAKLKRIEAQQPLGAAARSEHAKRALRALSLAVLCGIPCEDWKSMLSSVAPYDNDWDLISCLRVFGTSNACPSVHSPSVAVAWKASLRRLERLASSTNMDDRAAHDIVSMASTVLSLGGASAAVDNILASLRFKEIPPLLVAGLAKASMHGKRHKSAIAEIVARAVERNVGACLSAENVAYLILYLSGEPEKVSIGLSQAQAAMDTLWTSLGDRIERLPRQLLLTLSRLVPDGLQGEVLRILREEISSMTTKALAAFASLAANNEKELSQDHWRELAERAATIERDLTVAEAKIISEALAGKLAIPA